MGEFLVGRAARHLPAAARVERYQEWAAELPVILGDPEIKPAAARAARMLWFAADTLRGAALGPGPVRRGGAHRGSADVGKDARWLGVGAALLTGLAVSLAILAVIVYYDIFICSASLAGYVSSLVGYSLACLVGCLLWRRPGGASRYWFGAGVLAAVRAAERHTWPVTSAGAIRCCSRSSVTAATRSAPLASVWPWSS
jgi:hypothetical protein